MITAMYLRKHAAETHTPDCSGRLYECTCGYDARTKALLLDAADRIEQAVQYLDLAIGGPPNWDFAVSHVRDARRALLLMS